MIRKRIEFFAIFCSAIAGILLGVKAADGDGALLGGFIGAMLMWCCLWLASRQLQAYPPCGCGTAFTQWALVAFASRHSYFQCPTCRETYIRRNARLWDRINEDGSSTPYMRRSFRGRWTLVMSDGRVEQYDP
jgi:predicted RNA-binding Zn-ribbon protein involved in translation (DUF1610 family)